MTVDRPPPAPHRGNEAFTVRLTAVAVVTESKAARLRPDVAVEGECLAERASAAAAGFVDLRPG